MAGHGEIFAERVADKAVVGQDAAQIGVFVEDDAVHIEGFALVPVCTVIQVGNGVNDGEAVVVRPHAHAHALVVLHGQQLADHGEAFAVPFLVFVGAVIHAAQVNQCFKMQLGMVAQGLHDVEVVLRAAFNGEFAECKDNVVRLAAQYAGAGCL